MADHGQVEQLKLEDFTVEKMADRIKEFWGKGILHDPIADQARSKDAVPGSGVPGDGIDDITGGETSQPYLPRTGADGNGDNGRYTFEEFYPVDDTAEPQPKNWLTFLHPADREFLRLSELELSDSESDSEVLKKAVNEMELPSFVAAENAQKYRNRLIKFLRYLNGDPKASYNKALYPSVPQPFMGDLHNPKVLVVTFNPGFHEFSDWALGAGKEQLAEATRQKLGANENLAKTFNQVHSKQQWVREQDALLAAITGKGVFVPWQLTDGTVPNFIFNPPLNCHGKSMKQWRYKESGAPVNGNWHTEYFKAPSQTISPGHPIPIREFIPQEAKTSSAGLAQVDIFPYATRESRDLEYLVGALSKNYTTKGLHLYSAFRAGLWPSQRPILDYILATLLTAAENGSIIICRSSVVNKNYWPVVMEIASGLAEGIGLSPGSLWNRCFVFSSQNAKLTLGNIRRYKSSGKGSKPTAKDIADLLQSN